jgi:hypothetical protein
MTAMAHEAHVGSQRVLEKNGFVKYSTEELEDEEGSILPTVVFKYQRPQ